MMKLNEIVNLFTQRGYTDREPKDHYKIFYEFDIMDFLYSDCTKKFEFEYKDNNVEKVVMVRYWFGNTEVKEITAIDELQSLI